MAVSTLRRTSLQELAGFAPREVGRKLEIISRASINTCQQLHLADEVRNWAERRGSPVSMAIAGEMEAISFDITKNRLACAGG